MKYYGIEEKHLEQLQDGTGVFVKIIDHNNQSDRNYGYGVLDFKTHLVYVFQEMESVKSTEK